MADKRITQNKKLIAYLTEHGSITTIEAFGKLNITRLAAKIYELEHLGYEISRETIRNGRDWYVRYYLRGEENV